MGLHFAYWHQSPQSSISESHSGDLIHGVSDATLREFLESSVCLIVDTGSVTRNAIRKFFIDQGVMPNFCVAMSSRDEARSFIEQSQPKILVLDSELEIGMIKLLRLHREQFPDYRDSFVLIIHSGELSELTAEAVSLSADLFLQKPFSFEKLSYRFALLLAAKSVDSPIGATFRNGVKQLENRDDAGALESFLSVLKRYPECPRATREVVRILLQQQRWQEAEHWVWRLREESLLDPEWIPDVIEMASKINRYDYVEWLADAVKEMPKSKLKIISAVAHGMSLLAARLASVPKERGRALNLYQRAVTVSKHAPETYTEVIQSMYAADMLVEADILLRGAPEEVRHSEDTKMLLLEYLDQNRDATEVINTAYQYYRSGIRTPRVYQILIERSKELNRTNQVIVELIEEGARIYPDWAATFNSYR
jgi:DNA-binding NarL/FixJ family response regulator